MALAREQMVALGKESELALKSELASETESVLEKESDSGGDWDLGSG